MSESIPAQIPPLKLSTFDIFSRLGRPFRANLVTKLSTFPADYARRQLFCLLINTSSVLPSAIRPPHRPVQSNRRQYLHFITTVVLHIRVLLPAARLLQAILHSTLKLSLGLSLIHIFLSLPVRVFNSPTILVLQVTLEHRYSGGGILTKVRPHTVLRTPWTFLILPGVYTRQLVLDVTVSVVLLLTSSRVQLQTFPILNFTLPVRKVNYLIKAPLHRAFLLVTKFISPVLQERVPISNILYRVTLALTTVYR